MLSAESLTKRFNGVAAVDDVSLTVARGEVFALLGPNGAGKTTTINCSLGFVAPDSGRMTVGGVDVSMYPLETKRLLAYIPEQVNFYCHFSGWRISPISASLPEYATARRSSVVFR